jgi:steroid delta-isomerase-like uncharacterized protein
MLLWLLLAALCVGSSASAWTNKEIVRRVTEAIWNQGNLGVADELFAADFVNHDPNPGGADDLASLRNWILRWRDAFPDLHVEVHDLIADEDWVAARSTLTGTHQGDFFAIPATGLQVTMKAINIYRLAGGRIAEVHRSYDLLGVGQQVGYYEPLPEEAFPYSFVRRTKAGDFRWGEPSGVTGAPGDPESNKALCIREIEEGWNEGDAAAALAVVSPTFVWHSIYPEVTDYEGYTRWIQGHMGPEDVTPITIQEMFAEGDRVVDLATADLGDGMVESGIRISRFADGKMVEMWRNINALPLLVAFGLLPPFPEFEEGLGLGEGGR